MFYSFSLNYLILGLQFLLVSGEGDNRNYDLDSEVVNVYLRNNVVSSLTIRPIYKKSPVKGHQCFGAECNGVFIIGVEQKVYEYTITYKENALYWSPLPPTNMDRSGSRCCVIGDNQLFVTGGHGQGRFSSEMLYIAPNKSSTAPKNFFSLFDILKEDNFNKLFDFNWKACPTKPPANVRYHTMTSVGNGEVILIGGVNMKRGNDVYSKNVYLGKITENKDDVTWEEISPLLVNRYGHIAFKIQGCVVAAGGCKGFGKHQSSEIFDLKTGLWNHHGHSLPHGLSNASVIVDTQDRFAIITGGETDDYRTSNTIFVYTETNGFVEYKKKKLISSRKGHISLIIR